MKTNYCNFGVVLCFGAFLFYEVNPQIENLYEKCIKSDGALGECIPINRCTNTFSNIARHLENKREELKANQCGFYNDWPMICCQTEKIWRNTSKFNSTLGKCISLRQSIIGGQIAGKYDYRWLATLYTGEPSNLFCSGVLISRKYVLTAAHCLVDFPANLKTIGLRLGEVTLSKPDCKKKICEQTFSIDLLTDIKIHEHFNRNTKKNDIALIRLPANYTNSNLIAIGCLPTLPIERRWDLNTTAIFNIAGWGETANASISDQKLQANVRLLSQAECQKFYTEYGIEIDATQICAVGMNQENTCKGDSGASLSGLVERNDESVELVFGITSFGPQCRTGKPSVFTRISSFLEWIEENTNEPEENFTKI